MNFTLVSTVFNEIDRLERTISNLENQLLRPDEIIITDAGSTDGTYERLIRWKAESVIPIKILRELRCNVARGRNLAISAASYDIIASTDFGCVHDQHWLQSLMAPFESDLVEVVGGNYGVLESDIVSLPAKAEYILQNGYNLPFDETFTVSSRSIAYRKHVWIEIGGYPEWLTLAGDDSSFWKLIKAKGYKYELVRDIHVYWGRHEQLTGFIKENQRYGLGDGESRTNLKNTFSHITELAFRYAIAPVIIAVYFFPVYIFVLPFLLFGLRSYYRAVRNWFRLRSDKYSFGVLLYCFYMIERLRWAYLKFYYKGFFLTTADNKARSKDWATQMGDYVG
jgi:glycosyltransferase involved in cell wall biosynthesis